MNWQKIKDTLLFILLLGIVLYIVSLNRCEQPQPINTELVDSLKTENAVLLDDIFELHAEAVRLDSTIFYGKTKYIQGKERIKTIKETITITDTVVIRYTDALEAQIKQCDTLIEVQDSQIVVLKTQVGKLEKVVSNDSTILSETEKELEAQQSQNKKQARKIKGLKITAIAAPIATLLLLLSLK